MGQAVWGSGAPVAWHLARVLPAVERRQLRLPTAGVSNRPQSQHLHSHTPWCDVPPSLLNPSTLGCKQFAYMDAPQGIGYAATISAPQ